jgi:hypothetical protein
MQHYIIFFIIVKAVHVSSGLSAHHQVFKSVHTALGICQTCLLLPLVVAAPDDGRKDCLKHVEL